MSQASGKQAPAKLSEVQMAILREAAVRDDRCLTPPSRGAPAARMREKLIEAGLVREVKANSSMPVWRRDAETGKEFALRLTAAGTKAIVAVDTTVPSNEALAPRVGESADSISAPQMRAHRLGLSHDRPAPRSASKIAGVLALLSRPDGATLLELVAATGWLSHTTRAALTGLRKRGYALSRAHSDRGAIYRVSAKPEPAKGAGGRVAEAV